MVRVTGWAALFILLSSFALAEQPARLALVIGNQEYAAKVGPLKDPHTDAGLIEASLKQFASR